MALYQELLKRRNPVGLDNAADGGMDMLLQQVGAGSRAPAGKKPSTLSNDHLPETDDSIQDAMMERLMQQHHTESRSPPAKAGMGMGKPIKKPDAATAAPKPAAAAASKFSGAAAAAGGGGLMEMLQGMMRGGRPADISSPVAEEEEQAAAAGATCAGGSCLAEDRPAPRGAKPAARGKDGGWVGGGAARMKKGSAGGGAGVYDAVCQQQFGEHAVFDGVDGCACSDGYDLVDGECVPARGPARAAARGSLAAPAADDASPELAKVCVCVRAREHAILSSVCARAPRARARERCVA